MPERKTVGQLMEEMRLKAGAQNYHGHEYMDLERFAEDTRKAWRTRKRDTSRFSAMPKCARAICTMNAPTSCAERSLPC